MTNKQLIKQLLEEHQLELCCCHDAVNTLTESQARYLVKEIVEYNVNNVYTYGKSFDIIRNDNQIDITLDTELDQILDEIHQSIKLMGS